MPLFYNKVREEELEKLERKTGVIPGSQLEALATKAFSERIQIEIEGLQLTLKTPFPLVLLSWLRNTCTQF